MQPPPTGELAEGAVKYRGYYLYGNDVLLSYTVAGRTILETPSAATGDDSPVVQTAVLRGALGLGVASERPVVPHTKGTLAARH